jgi:hypothetical protein
VGDERRAPVLADNDRAGLSRQAHREEPGARAERERRELRAPGAGHEQRRVVGCHCQAERLDRGGQAPDLFERQVGAPRRLQDRDALLVAQAHVEPPVPGDDELSRASLQPHDRELGPRGEVHGVHGVVVFIGHESDAALAEPRERDRTAHARSFMSRRFPFVVCANALEPRAHRQQGLGQGRGRARPFVAFSAFVALRALGGRRGARVILIDRGIRGAARAPDRERSDRERAGRDRPEGARSARDCPDGHHPAGNARSPALRGRHYDSPAGGPMRVLR